MENQIKIPHLFADHTRGTVIFITGFQVRAPEYQYLISHLEADHYQVITYSSPDTTISNYQQTVIHWTNDVSTVIGNRKVIVIGHSVGGSVATHFCSYDKRCIRGIDMDGGAAFADKLSVPFLYIQADISNYCDKQCIQGRQLMEKIAKQPGVTMVHISGIKHYNFTDLRTDDLRQQDQLGSIDGRDSIYATIKAFLEKQK